MPEDTSGLGAGLTGIRELPHKEAKYQTWIIYKGSLHS